MKVFESGSGKWVMVQGENVRYTSDKDVATEFDLSGLISANESLKDFNRYSETLRVVENGSVAMPHNCLKVATYIKHKQLQHQYYGDDYVD